MSFERGEEGGGAEAVKSLGSQQGDIRLKRGRGHTKERKKTVRGGNEIEVKVTSRSSLRNDDK